jgi:hypothetical protein
VEAVRLTSLGSATEVRLSCWLRRAATRDRGETRAALDEISRRIFAPEDDGHRLERFA